MNKQFLALFRQESGLYMLLVRNSANSLTGSRKLLANYNQNVVFHVCLHLFVMYALSYN